MSTKRYNRLPRYCKVGVSSAHEMLIIHHVVYGDPSDWVHISKLFDPRNRSYLRDRRRRLNEMLQRGTLKIPPFNYELIVATFSSHPIINKLREQVEASTSHSNNMAPPPTAARPSSTTAGRRHTRSSTQNNGAAPDDASVDASFDNDAAAGREGVQQATSAISKLKVNGGSSKYEKKKSSALPLTLGLGIGDNVLSMLALLFPPEAVLDPATNRNLYSRRLSLGLWIRSKSDAAGFKLMLVPSHDGSTILLQLTYPRMFNEDLKGSYALAYSKLAMYEKSTASLGGILGVINNEVARAHGEDASKPSNTKEVYLLTPLDPDNSDSHLAVHTAFFQGDARSLDHFEVSQKVVPLEGTDKFLLNWDLAVVTGTLKSINIPTPPRNIQTSDAEAKEFISKFMNMQG
jgi:hypothetical protein